jgi:hypothetical protein
MSDLHVRALQHSSPAFVGAKFPVLNFHLLTVQLALLDESLKDRNQNVHLLALTLKE